MCHTQKLARHLFKVNHQKPRSRRRQSNHWRTFNVTETLLEFIQFPLFVFVRLFPCCCLTQRPTSFSAFFFSLSKKSFEFMYAQSLTVGAFMSQMYVKPPASQVAMASEIYISLRLHGWWHDSDEEWKRTVGFVLLSCREWVVTDRLTTYPWLDKQGNVRILFLYNKSLIVAVVFLMEAINFMQQPCFSLQRTTAGPAAMRFCADVHGNHGLSSQFWCVCVEIFFCSPEDVLQVLMNTCTCTHDLQRLTCLYWSPALPCSTTRWIILI